MRDITLDHRYAATDGPVLATGIQALARLPLEQARLDRARGHDTAGFISGYRGSPLGGYDQELEHARQFLSDGRIVFQPGVNEELAATAVWGTQQVGFLPGAKHEGVFALWYGKAPGVDRAIDAVRHGNFAGTSPLGGVLLIAGDDPECKSSTLPSQSEFAFIHAEIPVLNPSDIQEVLDYGIAGIALSRYSGCWVALMATTDNMDSHAVIEVGTERYTTLPVYEGKAGDAGPHIRLNDSPMAQENRLRKVKLPAVIDFIRRTGINRRIIDGEDRRIGIVTTGRAHGELMQALSDLGLDDSRAAALGLSVLKIGMPWPLDLETVRDFADGLEEILVVEDKRPLVESQLRDALYDLPDARKPRITGKRDAEGNSVLPETGIITSADIAQAILARLPRNVISLADARVKLRTERGGREGVETRSPFYCSGCPHNRSTRVIPGSQALAGIGCHYMARWTDPATDFFSQMGGEGVQWVGQAPFTDMPHIFANLGDGTYFHSGLMAIRQAVAAKARMTYKILYNDAVAMTGGQAVDGALDVAAMTRQLAAEGVKQIAVVAEDPARHDKAAFASGVTLHPRAELPDVERRFRDLHGVTAIIYDQMCASEKRRRRKRGQLADAPKRVFINELVCEGCGDCSAKSNCISVEPVETDLGRKRRINQSSCNKDYTCVEGFCPSFVTIAGGEPRRLDMAGLLAQARDLPTPAPAAFTSSHNILISGIGGLGVTTLAGILSMAAFLDNRAVRTLNRTGLAQKGGAVASHVRVAMAPEQLPTPSVPLAEADLHLAYDMIVAAGPGALARTAPARTATVINRDLNPTSAFVRDTAKTYDAGGLELKLRNASRDTAALDARHLSEAFLGNELYGNMIMLGYALQKGWLPVTLDSLSRAIILNGTAEAQNRAALDLGRLACAKPEAVANAVAGMNKGLAPAPTNDLAEIIAHRARYLADYQNDAYAARYTALVNRVRAAEEAAVPGTLRLTETVARAAFAAMIIKDEYEVARLLSGGAFARQIGANFAGDYKVSYHLAPSWLARKDKTTGEPRKMTFGPWLRPVLKAAARLKALRETPFDLLRLDPLRRAERRLRDDYIASLSELLANLSPHNHTLAVEIAALPLEIRGYGHIKERAMEKADTKRRDLWARFLAKHTEPTPPPDLHGTPRVRMAG